MKVRTGRVTYGGRAFHQDASDAMGGGDLIRALIETITNSDDAYGDADGKIRIEIEHRRGGPWSAVTRDRASGMSAARMEEAIAHLGERTSGFELGANVRGNLGRGAKDLAAFGVVTFESISGGGLAKMALNPDGTYVLEGPSKTSNEDRRRLKISRGNGTVVTMHVTENIRCPQHSKLASKLQRHFQLRDIMASSLREVLLADINHGTTDILRYTYPTLPVVFNDTIRIPGYPEAEASLTILQSSERFDEPSTDPCRPGGLLIKGRRAIYENTLFAFEGNPNAGWFSGQVKCAYIDRLAAEYDRRLLANEQQDEVNPVPIISRRRDGLQHSHPFFKALAAAVEGPLGALVQEEEQRARSRPALESEAMRQMLDTLGRDLSRLLDEDLKELEEEGLQPTTRDGTNLPPISIIPEEAVLYLGEDKALSVLVRADLCSEMLVAEVDPGGVVQILDGPALPLRPHKSRADLCVTQVHLRPLIEEETLLTVSVGGYSATSLLEVRSEREVDLVPVPAPETLQFERPNYRIAWTKKRTIALLAPLSIVAEHGSTVKVTSSAEGVLVRRGFVELALDEEHEFYSAEVDVEARTLATKATITGELGPIAARCTVIVTAKGEAPELAITIVPEEAGNYRSYVEHLPDRTVIKIMGLHPIVRRYRGDAPPFPGDSLPTTKLLIAEIVADQAARMLLERKFPSSARPEQLDAPRFYAEHYFYMTKYLMRCHRSLLNDAELVHLGDRLLALAGGHSLELS